jgi:hypothetical protein
MTARKRNSIWALWCLSTVALVVYFAARLTGGDRTVFLPGATSAGHYQIELACGACHGDSFASADGMQAKCEGCHGAALDEARDAHPQSKFTDPRNADRVALLDARYCVACHVEHKPEVTDPMGVTLPGDFCALCHQTIGAERPSHVDFEYATCASSGCHNFHDNRALYEDFLLRHANQEPLLTKRELPERNFASIAALIATYPRERFPLEPLTAADHDAPADMAFAPAVVDEWAASAHAENGVNCTACHASAQDGATAAWVARPDHASCSNCHATESGAFVLGRHGMRLNAAATGVELTPMQPRFAKLPMQAEARDRPLDCGSCHSVHRVDTVPAAVEACLGCHADEHSSAYRDSPHGREWQLMRTGAASGRNAVTCATCHMPRTPTDYDWGAYTHVLVQHNQSDNLRPNEKMLRPVCTQCHGLGFSIDALADPRLIRNNFNGQPSVHVQSIELAVARRRAIELERQAQRANRGDTPAIQPQQ